MKSIVQIELTNHCNRRCSYCGQPGMKREKGFMDLDTFLRCVNILKALNQTTVGMHHFGESLMHPEFLQYVTILNQNSMKPFIYTNGDFLTDDFIRKLTQRSIHNIVISGHMEYNKRVDRRNKCAEFGLEAYWQVDLSNPTDLGGQIEVPNDFYGKGTVLQDPANHCRFLVDEMCCVLYNGDLVPCCFDFEGVGVFGNIHDEDVLNKRPLVNKMCKTCPGHPGNIV